MPIVTLTGPGHASRISASILTTLGQPDWIAGTPEEYVAAVVKVAGDWQRLAHHRASLRERMRATLGDGRRVARNLEDAYRVWWRRWCAERGQQK